MVWHTVPKFVQGLFPNRIWEGDPTGKRVYLTFDDGPVPGITDFVLNELSKRNQKATFFMVGDNVRKHPALANEVLAQGHQIGNHTFNHLKGWDTADSVYLDNVKKCDLVFEEELGVGTDLFRPPYGLIKISQAKPVLESKRIIMWNVLTGDYDRSILPSEILKKSIQMTLPGSIVLFHDQQKTSEVLPKVLPQYLNFLEDNGFKSALL
ncbi:polysaccharide deacetylase family protein [Algoriphagus lacus]|uniref:Polysaccharide deacetylase family protein n=1 Tax=Algoriphagus lacus TaxID=2056311 RepID=A0A418PPK4_9BACT|nr:polysaccharide deacetylase family protein [Algoriphagus lacus]RIW14021.1 polysaccharide deacetylase family protein [Algoriphagus lacus]